VLIPVRFSFGRFIMGFDAESRFGVNENGYFYQNIPVKPLDFAQGRIKLMVNNN
jgi:hypothetical protein